MVTVRPDGSIDLNPPRHLPAQWVKPSAPGQRIVPTVDELIATLQHSTIARRVDAANSRPR